MEPMTTKEILIKINNIKKGTWVNLIKVKKLTDSITKYTQMTIRLGIDYSHMKEGKEKPEPLPWGKWLITNLVIEHKGNLYLRVANAYTKNAKSWYLKDGKEIDKSMVVAELGEKKVASSESAVYNIKFENILALGN